MVEKFLEVLKARDAAFIQQFCSQGTYIGEHGETIHGMCRTITAEEMLTFMHTHDALIVEALKEVTKTQEE